MENKQYLTCLIYSNSILAGQNKLKEIIKLKEENGVKVIRRSSWYNARAVEFSDGETWSNIILHQDSSRGIKWHKAWIDSRISLEEYNTRILVACWSQDAYLFGMEFFNGRDYEEENL